MNTQEKPKIKDIINKIYQPLITFLKPCSLCTNQATHKLSTEKSTLYLCIQHLLPRIPPLLQSSTSFTISTKEKDDLLKINQKD